MCKHVSSHKLGNLVKFGSLIMAVNAIGILKMSRFCERFVFWNG